METHIQQKTGLLQWEEVEEGRNRDLHKNPWMQQLQGMINGEEGGVEHFIPFVIGTSGGW
jgi:hypothetical protein